MLSILIMSPSAALLPPRRPDLRDRRNGSLLMPDPLHDVVLVIGEEFVQRAVHQLIARSDPEQAAVFQLGLKRAKLGLLGVSLSRLAAASPAVCSTS